MKSIHTLVKDIYGTVGEDGWFKEDYLPGFTSELKNTLLDSSAPRQKGTLRLSKMGEVCPCQLWHSVNTPELAEPYQPWAKIKFTYGHILEALAIVMAKAAGHEVTGEQDECTLDGIKGHRDCVIDGCIVDIKSINSLGFQKVKAGLTSTDIFLRDYLDQLDGYTVASYEDPLVQVKDKAYILFIDKVKGHLHLYEHRIREASIRQRVNQYKRIVLQSEPPACTCETVSDGESGNIKLGLKGSYNPYKHCCKPELRTFIYSDGPRYLTRVVRRPMYKGLPIKEVDRLGNVVYNGF